MVRVSRTNINIPRPGSSRTGSCPHEPVLKYFPTTLLQPIANRDSRIVIFLLKQPSVLVPPKYSVHH